MSTKPNCYTCKFRHDLPGDAHSSCGNQSAHVTGNAHGIRMGWFAWPWNFDPTWLESCDGYEAKESEDGPTDAQQERLTEQAHRIVERREIQAQQDERDLRDAGRGHLLP